VVACNFSLSSFCRLDSFIGNLDSEITKIYMAYVFPEKIFPNSLNTYIQCPFKFKCHNDKEIKAEFVEKPESFMGQIIHLALKHLFDIAQVPADKRRDQDLGQLVRHFWARMPKSGFSKDYWNSEERRRLFGSREQEKVFGLQTIAILKNYIAGADLSVIPLSLEAWMDCQVGEFTIAGRIDRIDQDSESSVSVWDYKTGKLPYHDSVEKMIEENVQIPIYAVIASKCNPFAKQIRVGLVYIKYSKIFDITWTKEQLKKIEDRIVNIIKEAKDNHEFLPRINKLCPWCEYRNVCPDKDKIEEKYTKIDEVKW